MSLSRKVESRREREMPFELRALEAALAEGVKVLEIAVGDLERVAFPTLENLIHNVRSLSCMASPTISKYLVLVPDVCVSGEAIVIAWLFLLSQTLTEHRFILASFSTHVYRPRGCLCRTCSPTSSLPNGIPRPYCKTPTKARRCRGVSWTRRGT